MFLERIAHTSFRIQQYLCKCYSTQDRSRRMKGKCEMFLASLVFEYMERVNYCRKIDTKIAVTNLILSLLVVSCFSPASEYQPGKQISIRWWRHQMETFSALLAICAGNSPVSDEFPAQRPVTRSFDVFFDLRLGGRLSKHSWGWWLETPSCPWWRQSNDTVLCTRNSL